MTEAPATPQVPRDHSGRNELLALKPDGWEFFYFGAVLLAGLERTEPKWRDYRLGISMRIGERIPRERLAGVVSEMWSVAETIASKLEMMLRADSQEAAFGLPGEPGDEYLIAHLGNRLVETYEQLLDWADDLRALRLESVAKPVQDIGVLFVSQPVQEFRDFVARYVTAIEKATIEHVEGTEPKHIVLELKFEVADDVVERFNRALNAAIA